jgi:Ca2+-binding RTX toxin-like protein
MNCLGRVLAVGMLLAAFVGQGPLAGGAAVASDVGGKTATAAAEAGSAGVLASPECFGREATIVGTKDDDVLVGTNGTDVIHGRGGDDLIRGLAGRDYICLGIRRPNRHNDSVLRGNRGNDHLRGSGGRLNGGLGDDVVKGFRADVFGGDGNDSLAAAESLAVPRPGRDRVQHGFLSYRDAKRSVRVDLARGRAYGQGMDILTSVYAVDGSAFGDVLKGDENNNDLYSRAGNDTVYGRGGDDDILSGEGVDTLYGRRGEDDLWDGGGKNDTGYGGPGGDTCQNIEHRFSCRVWHD